MPLQTQGATPYVPESRDLPALRSAVQKCEGCEIYRNATQAVFGELETRTDVRRPKADVMMIGEQPGDQEDRAGRPFVGPAGKLLDKCLVEAGIDRRGVYVTNTVKHFKWQPRGKLRLHKKPSLHEVEACRPWLEAEMESVRPKLIICLGATAAQALMGPSFRITRSRGQFQQRGNLPPVIATMHPSAILRARTPEDRERDTQAFVQDLRKAAAFVARAS